MKTTFDNTRELITSWPGLEPDLRLALLGTIATKGRWAGYVLTSAPGASKSPKRYAAWQAVMGQLAPSRMSIGGLLFMSDEARSLFDRLDSVLQGPLGLAIKAQEPSLRWSLFGFHYDVQALRERFYQEVAA